jgi:hypothetical protein
MAMTLIIDQPAVVRADGLEAALEATGREDLEERRDVRVRLVAERCGGGLEGLVPRRRAPAPVASPAEGGSR